MKKLPKKKSAYSNMHTCCKKKNCKCFVCLRKIDALCGCTQIDFRAPAWFLSLCGAWRILGFHFLYASRNVEIQRQSLSENRLQKLWLLHVAKTFKATVVPIPCRSADQAAGIATCLGTIWCGACSDRFEGHLWTPSAGRSISWRATATAVWMR